MNVYVVDPDPTVAASIQNWSIRRSGIAAGETFADIDSLGSLGREDEPGLLLVNRGMPGFSGRNWTMFLSEVSGLPGGAVCHF